MKRHACWISFVCCAALALHAGEAPAEAPPADGAATLDSHISKVTVFADRAGVTRSAQAALQAGTAAYAFRKLPGWIDEGSVRVRVEPPAAAELADVQIEKTYLARASEEEVRKAEADLQEIADKLRELQDRQGVLEAKRAHVDAIKVFSLDKLPKDAQSKDFKIETYKEVVDFIAASLLEIAKEGREIDAKRRELLPEQNARSLKLQDLRQRAQLEQRTVRVWLKAQAAGAATVHLSYLLPGATWEPAHELRAGKASEPVALGSYAIVTQTTGEDWNGAEITLSTQRATTTLRLPELEGLLAGATGALADQDGVQEAATEGSFQAAQKGYLSQRSYWNRTFNKKEQQEIYEGNASKVDAQQARILQVFSQIQERGTTALFTARGGASVRTDGRPVRLGIGSVQLNARRRIMAAPEVSANAARTLDLSNTGNQPLLPGKVSLFVDGAFLGTTEVAFVAQGEAFSLFLGVADRIKLARTLDRKASFLDRGGSRHKLHLAFVVTAENLDDAEAVLELTDRIPISQLDDVRVRDVRIAPEALPDAKGLVHWDARLAAKQTKVFRVEYTLEYPPAIVQQLAAKPEAETMRQRQRDAGELILEYQKGF